MLHCDDWMLLFVVFAAWTEKGVVFNNEIHTEVFVAGALLGALPGHLPGVGVGGRYCGVRLGQYGTDS